ncbi:hypothetical protein [Undibacterium sp. Tian12W]|uniref:hypothetical protein n=1 Tax=Undibacterium sp. Tian12W TaxID=3413054 RepID=UPI003BF51889
MQALTAVSALPFRVMRQTHLIHIYEMSSNISYPGDEEMTDREEYLWHQAIAHLDFLIKFGTDKTQIEQDGKFYFSHVEDFEQWLGDGAIGVTLDELQKYLKHYPM